MRLDAAENLVRIRTQTVGDTTRLTPANLDLLLNKVHKELRTNLQEWAPTLYLHTTGNLVLAAGDTIALTSATAPFERLRRVEVRSFTTVSGGSFDPQRWVPVERSGDVDAGRHIVPITFEMRNGEIVFHPEGEVGGTFRVLYHWTPADLALAADLFQIPAVLDRVLITQTAVEVYEGFRDYKERDKQLERVLLELNGPAGSPELGALSILAEQYGVHDDASGLREVQGY